MTELLTQPNPPNGKPPLPPHLAELKASALAAGLPWPPPVPRMLTMEQFEVECERDLVEGWASKGITYKSDPYPPRPAGVEIISMESLEMEPTEWLWDGWLARGSIELIAGVPEAGKTTCLLSFAAIKSSGGYWPDGTKAEPGNVLIWTGEDDPARTIKPRLVAMGADLKKISFVKAKRDENGKVRPFNPATDLLDLALAARLITGGVDLLIIDPLASVVGGKVDNGNNAGHREKLQPLVDFARDMNCVAVGVTHFTKGTVGKNPIDRVTGSLAFGAVARVVFAATQNKGGDPERMFIRVKNNLGLSGGGFGYSIVGAPLASRPDITATRIVWGAPLEGAAIDLLAEAEGDGDGGKVSAGGTEATGNRAEAFLEKALEGGERLQKEIAAEGAALGFSSDRLFRTSRDMGVVKRKEGLNGPWFWRLPVPF